MGHYLVIYQITKCIYQSDFKRLRWHVINEKVDVRRLSQYHLNTQSTILVNDPVPILYLCIDTLYAEY